MGRAPVDMKRVERLGAAAHPPRMSARELAFQGVLLTTLGAVFPRLAYRARWLTRVRPRTVVIYIVARTGFGLAVDAGMRWMARISLQQQNVRERLSDELGRDPTREDVMRAWLEERRVGESGANPA
jgi:hypothetical protein